MSSSPSFWNPVLTVGRRQPLQWGLIYLNGSFHCMDTNPMGNWHWTVCLYMFPLMSSHCVRWILFLSFLEFQGRSISLYMFLRCSIWPQALPAPGDQAFTIINGFHNTSSFHVVWKYVTYSTTYCINSTGRKSSQGSSTQYPYPVSAEVTSFLLAFHIRESRAPLTLPYLTGGHWLSFNVNCAPFGTAWMMRKGWFDGVCLSKNDTVSQLLAVK